MWTLVELKYLILFFLLAFYFLANGGRNSIQFKIFEKVTLTNKIFKGERDK